MQYWNNYKWPIEAFNEKYNNTINNILENNISQKNIELKKRIK